MRRLEATILHFASEDVFVAQVYVGENEYHIRLPISIVPAELRLYAQPIFIELGTLPNGSLGNIKIKRRIPNSMPPLDSELAEWLKTVE